MKVTTYTYTLFASIAFAIMMSRIFPTQSAESSLFGLSTYCFSVFLLLTIVRTINDLGDRIVNARQEAAEKALQEIITKNKGDNDRAIPSGSPPK